MSTFGDIRNNFQIAMNNMSINEGLSAKTTKAKQPFWDSYFKNVDVAAIPINTKAREVIRAPFGSNFGGVADKNIMKMFVGAGYEVSDIQFNDKGVLRSPKNDLGSNDYPTYVVITTDGDEYYVTNNVVELEDGTTSEIGKKVTNPSSLGVADIKFKSAKVLIDDYLIPNINTKSWSDNTKSYMIGLAKAVNEKASATFTDMEKFWKAGEVSETINLDGYVDTDVDERSRRNLINDYGEVLDGIYILKTVKDLGDDGLVFPGSGNEALADLYVHPWAISSKAKKGGGKPSINALVGVVADNETKGLPLNPADSKEQALYDMLVEFSKILKGRTLPTVESYILAANVLMENGSMKNSGFEFFIKTSKLDPNIINRTDIMAWLESYAREDAEKFDKFIVDYRKLCGVKPKLPMTAETFLKDPIGDGFYYPFAVEIAKVLNKDYTEALKTLINKFLVVKQMYFGIDVKKGSLSIRSTSSSTIKAAKFMARGSAKNFNAGLAYEMK